MSIVFQPHATAKLSASLASGATTAYIDDVAYKYFLENGSAGDYFYCAIRNAITYEIVKVAITGSSQSAGLSITRQQDSTTSPATWAKGTLIYNILNAGMYNELRQKDGKSYAGDPNGNVPVDTIGQWCYDSTNIQHYKGVSGTTWKLCTDGLYWYQHFDFEASEGWTEVGSVDNWDETNSEWFPLSDDPPSLSLIDLQAYPGGGDDWNDQSSFTLTRITFTGIASLQLRITESNGSVKLVDDVMITSGEEVPMAEMDDSMYYIRFAGLTVDLSWRITNIEFAGDYWGGP